MDSGSSVRFDKIVEIYLLTFYSFEALALNQVPFLYVSTGKILLCRRRKLVKFQRSMTTNNTLGYCFQILYSGPTIKHSNAPFLRDHLFCGPGVSEFSKKE